MKNSESESEQNFYIDSDMEDDEEKVLKEEEEEEEEDGNESDLSHYSMGDRQHSTSRPQSYQTSWPQSYRQSIDLYSSVPSPNIGFLGTSSLQRLTSSFLIQKHTPETKQPLLPTAADEQQRRSSHSLLPPIPSRRSSVIKKAASEHKPSRISHEFPSTRQSTFGQAVLNGMNVLCGVGILSTPYAVKEGGWLSLSILFIFALLSFYTGVLLRSCLDSAPGLETYPDIGQAAFGKIGRFAISIVLYVELYACCVEYIILESDNLSSLFPNAHLNLGWYELDSHHLFALIITIAVLPTCWLRDLSVLSYISAGGVIASILVVLCLFWLGLVDHVGYYGKGSTLNMTTLPVALGLYGYCYSGHAVFPNIYTSMEKPSQFPAVLFTSFGLCTLLYAGVAVMGYLMFGENTLSQFTLSMPKDLVATKVALWTTVVNPFTKYPFQYSCDTSPSPFCSNSGACGMAMSLEELIPSQHLKSHVYAILIRTGLVMSTLVVALVVPFFGFVMAFIGSLLTMLVTLILPCACYLSILRGKVSRFQVGICILIIVIGVVSSALGTYSAVSKIIESMK
ncbi:Amino acid transporter avt1c [Dionaea muscipula]